MSSNRRNPSGKGSMLQLPQIKSRIDRLRELARGLGQGVASQKDADGPLAPLERRNYVMYLMNALAEMEQARVVLMNLVKRLEKGRG
jgi:hypothetical protein